MKKFMVIYHAPVEATEQMANASPDQMKEGMKPWMQWAQKCVKRWTKSPAKR